MSSERDKLEDILLCLDTNVFIVGKDANRLPNTSLIVGISAHLPMYIPLTRNAGSCCRFMAVESSRCLIAMGLQDNELVKRGDVVRISLGRYTTNEDLSMLRHSFLRGGVPVFLLPFIEHYKCERDKVTKNISDAH